MFQLPRDADDYQLSVEADKPRIAEQVAAACKRETGQENTGPTLRLAIREAVYLALVLWI